MTHTKSFLTALAMMVTLLFVVISLHELIYYFVNSPAIATILSFALLAAIGLALAVWLDRKDSGNAGS